MPGLEPESLKDEGPREVVAPRKALLEWTGQLTEASVADLFTSNSLAPNELLVRLAGRSALMRSNMEAAFSMVVSLISARSTAWFCRR